MKISPKAWPILLIFVLTGNVSALQAQSSTCIRAPGKVAFFPGGSTYHTTERFDSTGRAGPIGDGAVFTRTQANVYAEAGIAPGVALMTNVALVRLHYRSNSSDLTNVTVGNPEVGVQLDVTRVPVVSSFFCSFQLLTKLPFRGGGEPLVGFDQTDMEAKARALGWLQVSDRAGYWVLDMAYRHRFGPPGDVLKTEATAGLTLSPEWMLLLQLFATTDLPGGEPMPNGRNPGINADYSSYQPQIGVVYALGGGVRGQAAWSREIAGKNAGRGNGFSLVFWVEP